MVDLCMVTTFQFLSHVCQSFLLRFRRHRGRISCGLHLFFTFPKMPLSDALKVQNIIFDKKTKIGKKKNTFSSFPLFLFSSFPLLSSFAFAIFANTEDEGIQQILLFQDFQDFQNLKVYFFRFASDRRRKEKQEEKERKRKRKSKRKSKRKMKGRGKGKGREEKRKRGKERKSRTTSHF